MDCFAPLAMTVGLFDNRILLRRPGEGRDPYAVFCRSKDSVRRLPVTTNTSGCWGGRPPTASMCQNEVVVDLNKEAVRERSYPHWSGHVQECFSAAWCECGRAAGAAQEVAAAAG